MREKSGQSLIEAVSENIRLLRKRSRMTQTELAEAAGLSRATIAQIEGSRYGSFSFSSLEAIARVLDVSEAALLDRNKGEVRQSRALARFSRSAWQTTLKPTEAELHLLESIVALLAGGSHLSPSQCGELLQLCRRLQLTSGQSRAEAD